MLKKGTATFVLSLFALLCACSSPYQGMIRNEHLGIVYYLPHNGVVITTLDNGIRFKCENFILEVIDNHVNLDKKEIGILKEGDILKFTKTGHVFVNEKKVT